NGKIFANGSIYLAPQSSTLQIGASSGAVPLLAAAGSINRTVKRDGTSGSGSNPQIQDRSGTFRTLNFDHFENQNFNAAWTADQWRSAATSLFGGTVQDSAMGVSEIIPPVPALFYNTSNPDQVAHQLIELPQAGDSTDLAAAKMYGRAGL